FRLKTSGWPFNFKTNGEQSQSQYGFTEELLGSGKSTLGNLLLEEPHDDGTFYVSADMESVTQVCGTATITIDGINYNIVDTPGIFDTQKVTDEILNEIVRVVQKCAYGVKAILFVFEERCFTDEQKNVLEGIRKFLGEDAINYIIAIFSHATKAQISDRNVMRKAWNQSVHSFVNKIENRWSISPNSDYFPPDHPIHKARLGEIRAFISGMRGVYTTELLEKSRQEQEKAWHQQEEEERRIKQVYLESLKNETRKESQEAFKRKFKEPTWKHKVKPKYKEDLRRQKQKEAEEQFNKSIEKMRQEQKVQQEREDKLKKEEQQRSELNIMNIAKTNFLYAKLSQDYISFYENKEKYADVTIRVGKEENVNEFYVHSFVLLARSVFFCKKIEEIKEKQNYGKFIIEIPDINPKFFDQILRYFYGGNLKYKSNEIFEFLLISKEFNISELLDFLQSQLLQFPNQIYQNFGITLQISSSHELFQRLYEFCLKTINEHPEIIFKSQDFHLLNENTLLDLLQKKELNLKEIEKWKSIIKWGIHHTFPDTLSTNIYAEYVNEIPDVSLWTRDKFRDLANTLKQFIPLINFHKITPEDFYEKVKPFKRIMNKQFYDEILKYHLLSKKS
ncbi:AIG1 family-domain-containing protein, partial [Glomus cerebriforme]